MNQLTDFFILCSGANRAILNQCPGERTKYAGLGATIFFTGLFAFFSASYALYFVFSNLVTSLLFGLVWGLMIFNLDRYIVSTMRKRGSYLREFTSAIPRIIIAIIISIVIAKPLELKIFQKEIEPELVLMEQRVYAQEEREVRVRFLKEDTDVKARLKTLDEELSNKISRRDQFIRIAQEEADGTGGSKLRNLGPIYKVKKLDADKAEVELQQFRTQTEPERARLLKRLHVNDSLMDAAVRGLALSHRDGTAARLEALNNLEQSSVPIAVASWFIMLLIIAIETAPVFVKLISGKGPYDNLLNAEEFEFSTQELQSMAKTSSMARSEGAELNSTERNFLSSNLDKQLKTR